MSGTDVNALADRVRQVAFDLHRYLRHGHLEKVYENGLVHRLRKEGLTVHAQVPLKVRDEDGAILGDYCADMVVVGILLVELKACRDIAPEHVAQVLGYLRATDMSHGMLINFGSPKIQFKKLIL